MKYGYHIGIKKGQFTSSIKKLNETTGLDAIQFFLKNTYEENIVKHIS